VVHLSILAPVQVDLSVFPLDSVNELVKDFLSVDVENPLEDASSSIEHLASLKTLAESLVDLPILFLAGGRAVVGIYDRIAGAWGVFAAFAHHGSWLLAKSTFSFQRWVMAGFVSHEMRIDSGVSWSRGSHVENEKETLGNKFGGVLSKEELISSYRSLCPELSLERGSLWMIRSLPKHELPI
jgi:hypothetical protein